MPLFLTVRAFSPGFVAGRCSVPSPGALAFAAGAAAGAFGGRFGGLRRFRRGGVGRRLGRGFLGFLFLLRLALRRLRLLLLDFLLLAGDQLLALLFLRRARRELFRA